MDINLITEYSVPIIAIACFVISQILKTTITQLPTKYIPLLCGVLGIIFNIWIQGGFTFNIFLAGLCSGWVATGGYETVTKLIKK